MLNKFKYLCVFLIIFSCQKNDEKAKILLGMQLGGKFQDQIDSALKHGAYQIEQTLIYKPLASVNAEIMPYYTFNKNGDKVLGKVRICYQNPDLPISENMPGDRLAIDYNISAEDRDQLIKMFKSKYGENKGFKGFYEWDLDILEIRLWINEQKKGDTTLFNAQAEYSFNSEIQTKYQESLKKYQQEADKNNPNI